MFDLALNMRQDIPEMTAARSFSTLRRLRYLVTVRTRLRA